MTVGELIKELQQYPENTKVFAKDSEYGTEEPSLRLETKLYYYPKEVEKGEEYLVIEA